MRTTPDPRVCRTYVVTDVENESFKLEGLHAKILVCEGDDRVSFIGSANATGIAWGSTDKPGRPANCEAMVRMRPGLTIDAFVEAFVGKCDALKPWISEYVPEPIKEDADEAAGEALLHQLRRLGGSIIELTYDAARRRLELRSKGVANLLQACTGTPAVIEIAPVFLRERDGAFQPFAALDTGLVYDDVPFEEVCEFLFLKARSGKLERSVVLQARWNRLSDSANARDAAIRRELVKNLDPGALLRWILWGTRAGSLGTDGRTRSGAGHGGKGNGFLAELPGVTLERLLERCTEDESLVDEVETLLTTFEREDAFSPAFLALWAAFRAAWRSVGSEAPR